MRSSMASATSDVSTSDVSTSDMSNGSSDMSNRSSDMSNRSSDVSTANSSMRHTMGNHVMDHGSGVHGLGMPGLALVADLHHGAAIASISVVSHVLDPAVRESHAVLALDVPVTVPGPALAEVGVVVIVVDPVGEVEGVGLVVLLLVAAM